MFGKKSSVSMVTIDGKVVFPETKKQDVFVVSHIKMSYGA
jgi:hypothetical protein